MTQEALLALGGISDKTCQARRLVSWERRPTVNKYSKLLVITGIVC